ncbi:cation-translocating P-type ATPase [Corynebacterium frankenforstense]|uniref:heavy metal translocating P-type ATPase n=1 Tax=Corynebacterium frankenforstense TaxID=1230998 RepID=UPI0026EF7CAC|nr:HAD family hydrolase [Corynebacterium frankenforstense]
MSAEEQAARAEQTPPSGEGLDQVIQRARHAAARAGIEVEDDVVTLVSWAFDLENLGEETVDASDVEHLVAALEAVPGVHARIIYPDARAWVSAPSEIPGERLTAIFAQFGLTATPTPATRRRVEQLEQTRHARVRRNRRPVRRSAAEERALQRARREGWLRAAAREDAEAERRTNGAPASAAVAHAARRGNLGESRDVLYTARGLITTPRLVTAVILTVPVLLLSLVTGWQFDYWQWVTLVLSLPVVTWCAWPFHRALAGGVRRGATALDGASSIAVAAAFVWSLGALLFTDAGRPGWLSESGFFTPPMFGGSGPDIFLDVACGMTTLLLVGRRWSIQSRSSLVEELAAARPDLHSEVTIAQRRRHPNDPEGERLPLGEVNVGDDIVVTPGQLVPVDGMVVGGSGVIVASVLSAARGPDHGHGEGHTHMRGHGLGHHRHTTPTYQVSVGGHVGAGDRVESGTLKVRVRRTGHATRIAAVERWVAQVNRRQNDAVMLSTRSASWLIVVSCFLAVVSFLGWWWFTGNPTGAFATGLAVLACVAPPALALSSALALRLGTEAGARHGLLLRDGGVMRRLEGTDTLIFNRVGTLTASDMVVESVKALPGNDRDLLLRVAASLVADSPHPAARAIVRAARSIPHAPGDTAVPRRVPVTSAKVTAGGDFVATCTLPVDGPEGKRRERHVNARLWRPCTVGDLDEPLASLASAQGTPIIVAIGGVDRGVITLHDPVKEDAAEAVDGIEALGVETMMISRDIYPVARRFADSVGISRVLAGIAPGRKARTVRTVHTQGNTVTMVGDESVSAALRVADVGVLVSGTVPLEPDRDGDEIDRGVDVVVLRKDVRAIEELLALARRVCRIIDRNILFAWGYNAVAVVGALTGVLHPLGATVAMLAASLVIEAMSNLAARPVAM